MGVFVAVLVTLMVLTLVTVIVRSIKANKQRIADLKTEAARLNLSFDEQLDVHAHLSHFQLFNQGRSRRSRNVMRGKLTDLDIVIFDYQYTTGSGKNQSTHRQTVALFETTNEHLTPFSLRPEHVFHKLGQVFGYQDIDFDSHPEFSKRYLLRGSDEEQIRHLFGPQVLDHFEKHPGFCVEAAGGQLVFYDARKIVAADALETLLHDAVRVYALFTAD